MVKVYLNPGKLDEKLAAIDKFSESVRTTYGNIGRYYTNDPIEGGEDLRFYLDAFVSEGDDLIIHTQKIKDIKTKIEQLNSSGVATIDADGRITLEAPDDSVESPEKFQMWSRGYLDANDLSAGKSPLPSGRSIDEVRESMKFNKDDSTYANTFIDRVGPENLTRTGNYMADDNKEAPIIGEILATASRSWDKDKSKKYADLVIEGSKYKTGILNKMIGGHDANHDGVNDLKFGADFLVSLGQGAEAMDPKDWAGNLYQNADPILCVVDAMTNNEEAARNFLAPNGGDVKDIQRIKALMNRHPIGVKHPNASDRWLGDETWTDNWTRLSSITAEAHGQDNYDETTGSPQAQQAAAITTGVINTLGEEIKRRGSSAEVTAFARSNLSTALSKFPYSIDQTANGNTPATTIRLNAKGEPVLDSNGNPIENRIDLIMPRDTDSKQNDYWSNDFAWQPTFTVDGLSGVIQVVSEDSEELKKVAEPVGNMNRVKTVYAAAHNEGEDSHLLQEAISTNSKTSAFMLGASRARVEDNAAKVDANRQALIDTVFAATSFVPGPGKNAKEIWKMAADYGKTRSADVLKSAVEDFHTGHEAAEEKKSNYSLSEMNRISREDTIIQLIGLGAIDEDAVKSAKIRNDKHELVSLYDENGNFDASKVDDSVRSYLAARFITNSPDTPGSVYEGLKGMEDEFNNAYNRGHQRELTKGEGE